MFQKLALLCHQLSTNSKLLRALEGSPTPFHVHITYFYKGFNQFALCTDLPNPPSWSLEYCIKCLSLSGKDQQKSCWTLCPSVSYYQQHNWFWKVSVGTANFVWTWGIWEKSLWEILKLVYSSLILLNDVHLYNLQKCMHSLALTGATFPVHLILLYLIILVLVFLEEYNLWSSSKWNFLQPPVSVLSPF
jgi:hypothetical protein